MLRDHWTTRLGFVLAAAGSAVGLGNIWRFPYLAGENGGGAFLIIYLALVFTIGISVMLVEFSIGRAGQRDPVGALRAIKGGAWTYIGYFGVLAAFIILSFYSVVGGWTVAYLVKGLTGGLHAATTEEYQAIFLSLAESPSQPVLYHAFFMVLTGLIVIRGIGKGIEIATRLLMPILLILLILLIVRALTLPGAGEGVRFFLAPDFSRVGAGTVGAALSQAFFSLSVGMGAMITYGSYLSTKESLPGSAAWVTGLDTSIAILAGLLILPAVFAFGFSPDAGPGLIFITLPAIFEQMPGGEFFAVAFFALLVIAALTSAISLLEVAVAHLIDSHNVPRTQATLGACIVIFLLGIPSSLSIGLWSEFTLLGLGFMDLMDYISTGLMLPIGSILLCLFAGWVVWPRMASETTSDGTFRFALAPVWQVICRFLAPIAIVWILVLGLIG